ncbi:MAG: RagB/SusD family nutrient uptake outer membrane protein [Dysgonamonadaceae bacterium]|jgi:hypothetical protein|nr:RagB/SusD family nutrient uptake outer membrane protein [Dysgonamonadaceae bacterium]
MKARYNKMKRYFIVPLFLLLIAGCNDFLDLKPESTLPPAVFWQTKNDAGNWMAGVYNQMQRTFQYNWYDWGEARSDNNDMQGTGNAQLVVGSNTFNSSESSTNAIINWQQLYVTILLCNTGIKYFPEMIAKDIDAASATYTDYLGQCYGMRALMYFYAVRVWGRVPLVIDAIEDNKDPVQFPRASIREIRDQIESDARRAIELLDPIGTDNTRKYYLTKDAMYALLTDFYATFQEYNRVIEVSDTFALVSNCTWVANATDWKLLFTDPVNAQATENIFVMYWDYIEYGGGMGYATRLGSAANTANYRINNRLFEKLFIRQRTPANSDARWWHCFDSISYSSTYNYNRLTNVKLGKCYTWDGRQFAYDATVQCGVKCRYTAMPK